MNKTELDKRIEEAAKTIRLYALARTSSIMEAEDLSQDILLEVYASAVNLRDDRAFYGFMWSVAGNVYKRWCRNKRRDVVKRKTMAAVEGMEKDIEGSNEQIALLRRELSLLQARYREAVVRYYVNHQSCTQIAEELSISESMVKYLLFKSRQIMKEGMEMERNYGQQSYCPKKLQLQFWGCGSKRYENALKSKVAQNILYACDQDKLTQEQIGLEIGVALPYLEEDLHTLLELDLLKKDGRRYQTNIPVFTKEFRGEIRMKSAPIIERIAGLLIEMLQAKGEKMRQVAGLEEMSANSCAWQMVCMALYCAVVERVMNRHEWTYPVNCFGNPCFVWAEEPEGDGACTCGMSNGTNKRGDRIQFMDFAVHGEMMHAYCTAQKRSVAILLDIANGNTTGFSENDWLDAAEMIRRGYILTDGKLMRVNMPVFTKDEHAALMGLLEDTVRCLEYEINALICMISAVIKNHLPVHLRGMQTDMSYLRLLEDVICETIERLMYRNVLRGWRVGEMLPTTYIVKCE